MLKRQFLIHFNNFLKLSEIFNMKKNIFMKRHFLIRFNNLLKTNTIFKMKKHVLSHSENFKNEKIIYPLTILLDSYLKYSNSNYYQRFCCFILKVALVEKKLSNYICLFQYHL